jgi:hypothetical protein
MVIGHGDEAEVLLSSLLTRSSKLSDLTSLRRLRSLTTGVGIDFSIED